MKESLCPQCGQGDKFTTREKMIAFVSCEAILDDVPEPSETGEIFYESTKVEAISCQCGWQYEGDDWASQLSC